MGRFLVRLLGHKAAKHVVHRHTQPGGKLDVKYGFSLFRNPRVPITSKMVALTIGIGLTFALIALEAPLELILGLFVPFVGLGTDLMLDGLELVLFPMLIACLVLPRLLPRPRVIQAYVVGDLNRKS